MKNAQAQVRSYNLSRVHSHNDYWQKRPFWDAYEHGLGSIEADTYLRNDSILVGHNETDLKDTITLRKLYLSPLDEMLHQYASYPYMNKKMPLQLMIEMKTDGDKEIFPLLSLLQAYPLISKNPHMDVVITGHLPSDSIIKRLPSNVMFDGQIRYSYSKDVLSHIALLSDDLHYFVQWDGTTAIDSSEYEKLRNIVTRVHKMGKKVRFWNAPDNECAWVTFINLGVDYINTDHIEDIAKYFTNTQVQK